MLIEEFIQQFKLVKKRNPIHVNELLDYLQKSYIFEELSIVEYKKLFHELDKRKAEKPTLYFIKPSGIYSTISHYGSVLSLDKSSAR